MDRRGDSRTAGQCCPKFPPGLPPPAAAVFCDLPDALLNFCDDFSDVALPQWDQPIAPCVTTDPDRPGQGIRLSQPAGGGTCSIQRVVPPIVVDGDRFCLCLRFRIADGVARPDPDSPFYNLTFSGPGGSLIVFALAPGSTNWDLTAVSTGPPQALAVLTPTNLPADDLFHEVAFCAIGDEFTMTVDGEVQVVGLSSFADGNYILIIDANASATFGSDLRLDDFCLRSGTAP